MFYSVPDFKNRLCKNAKYRKKWSCKTEFINKINKIMCILFTSFNDENKNHNLNLQTLL